MPRSIALIGYGAIAKEIISALEGSTDFTISQVLVRPQRLGEVQYALGDGISAITTCADITDQTDFVLECAGHDAIRTYGPEILERGIDLGIVSIGALAEQSLQDKLAAACKSGNARLSIIPGAIGGIDALAAAGNQLENVSYTSRKPPTSWAGSPAEETHDLQAIKSETEIFKGTARTAATDFPKNANVVATVALAGIGFDRTTVSLMADPKATGNTHQIAAKGQMFDFSYTTQGAALPSNPKTSALTALSALRCIKARGSGLIV